MSFLPKFNNRHPLQVEFKAITQRFSKPFTEEEVTAFEEWAIEMSYKAIRLSDDNNYSDAITVLGDLVNLTAYYEQYRRQIMTMILISIQYQRFGEIEEAKKYGEKSISLCYEYDCGEVLGYAYIKLGSSYGLNMEFSKAFDLLKMGIEYCLKYGSYPQAVNAHVSIASMYGICKKYDIAIEYLELALNYAKKHQVERLYFLIYNCFADYYLELGQFDKVEEYAKKTEYYLRKSEENPSLKSKRDNYNFLETKTHLWRILAITHLKNKNYAQSIEYTEKAIAVANPANNFPWDFTYKCYMIAGRTYYQWQQYQKAKETFEKAIALYLEGTEGAVHENENLGTAYIELSKTYMRLGDIEQAIACNDKAIKESEKLEAALKGRIIKRVEDSFDLGQQLKSNKVDSQQAFLRSQMNPHFIFNTISTIQSLILKKDNKKAAQYLAKFSHLMRTTLENSRYKLISLEEEIKSLKDYLHLQQMRFESSFQFTISVAPSIDTHHSQIPPMLIQPFVENAILHGIKNKADGRIKLSFEQGKKVLKCTIDDNGKGITSKKMIPSKNTLHSTQIVQERLKNLGLEHNVVAKLDITNKAQYNDGEEGTCVLIHIPFFQEF